MIKQCFGRLNLAYLLLLLIYYKKTGKMDIIPLQSGRQ